jgi:hypothetical protein
MSDDYSHHDEPPTVLTHYSLGDGQTAICFISSLDFPHFPRNRVYAAGLVHRVWTVAPISYHCTLAKIICISASVEIIADSSFADCDTLSNVSFEFGSNLQRIEAHAFSRCSFLQSIQIPASVEFLGLRCFCIAGHFPVCPSNPGSRFVESWRVHFANVYRFNSFAFHHQSELYAFLVFRIALNSWR